MKQIIVIGGGIAGLQTAVRLAERGLRPVVVEKESVTGGKLRGWHKLFPRSPPPERSSGPCRRGLRSSAWRFGPA